MSFFKTIGKPAMHDILIHDLAQPALRKSSPWWYQHGIEPDYYFRQVLSLFTHTYCDSPKLHHPKKRNFKPLLPPNHIRDRPQPLEISQHILAHLPRHLTPLVNNDPSTILQSHRHQTPLFILTKMPRECSSRRRQLPERHPPVNTDAELRHRVGWDPRHVLGIRVRDVEERGVAVRHQQALAVLRDGDLGGGIACEDGGVAGPVGAAVRDGREGEPPVLGQVADAVARQGVGELGDEVVERQGQGAETAVLDREGAVAGAGAGGYGDGGAGGEEKGGWVDVEDAEEVAAEVGDQEVAV